MGCMSRRFRILLAASAASAAAVLWVPAAADEVRVLADMSMQPVVAAMAPTFEKRTGHRVTFVDEEFDLAVLPEPELERLGKESVVADGSITTIARKQRTRYGAAVSTSAVNSNAALSLLILLSSEDTQGVLKSKGLSAP